MWRAQRKRREKLLKQITEKMKWKKPRKKIHKTNSHSNEKQEQGEEKKHTIFDAH